MQDHIKEATKSSEEAMGLVENAVILGDLRAAYEHPLRERMQKVRMAVHEVHTSALELLERVGDARGTGPLSDEDEQEEYEELYRLARELLTTHKKKQAFCQWLLHPNASMQSLEQTTQIDRRDSTATQPTEWPVLLGKALPQPRQRRKPIEDHTRMEVDTNRKRNHRGETIPIPIVPGQNSTMLTGRTKCERCGNHMLTNYCSSFVREAGVQCYKFEHLTDTLRHYKAKYHYRCPWAKCSFHVLRDFSTTYEQREEMVWKHEKTCTVERTPRTELEGPMELVGSLLVERGPQETTVLPL